MLIHEVDLNEEVLAKLISFSEDWAAENSCYGYRSNDKSDIEGNRIFFAEDDGTIIGYLFGKVCGSKQINPLCRRAHHTLKSKNCMLFQRSDPKGLERSFLVLLRTLSKQRQNIWF